MTKASLRSLSPTGDKRVRPEADSGTLVGVPGELCGNGAVGQDLARGSVLPSISDVCMVEGVGSGFHVLICQWIPAERLKPNQTALGSSSHLRMRRQAQPCRAGI